jgi:hypothetical protein
MEPRHRCRRAVACAAIAAAALATLATPAHAAALPPSADAAQPENARATLARAFRETVLAWDDGDPDFIQNCTTGQAGMQLAVWFQAPPWATHIVAVQYYIMNDNQDNPQDPGAPSTLPFMVRIWKPGDGVPGASAYTYVPFSEMGEYPEDEIIEVELPEPVDITDPSDFPDRTFYAGLEWLYRNNPYIGLDFTEPVEQLSLRWNWTTWERLLGDAIVRAVVYAHIPETILVDQAGGGDYLTIQEGIDAAAYFDTVLVAPGTYTGPLNRSLTFGGKDLVVISDAGPDVTIIDCQGADRGFFLADGETPASRIEGFTVRNGVGSGGAIRCVNAAPTIVDCIFENTVGGEYGGAIYLTDPIGGPPGIERCTFTGNTSAGVGGAVRLDHSDVTIDRCTFEGNGAPVGGAIDCGTLSLPVITNSIFAFGTGGGVIHCPPSSASTISHCCVFGNTGGDSLCGDYHDNLFLDPLFCPEELTLHDDSPCLPAGNPWGEPIGAWGAGGCGPSTGAPELASLVLHPPRPNPTGGGTTIAFELPAAARATLMIFSTSGRRVRTILDGVPLTPGPHTAAWDGCDQSGRGVASGVYLCELAAGSERTRRTIVILR